MPKATKNPGEIKYVTKIIQSDNHPNSWGWVEFPYDLKELYGIGNLVPVKVEFDGIFYQGSLTKMGGKFPMILIKRDILAKLGKLKGDEVFVSVKLDDKPRKVKIPTELKNEFKLNKSALTIFKNLSYSHQKEYVDWINTAKKPETRILRASKSIDMILNKSVKS